jgi:hypothetical protein
MASGLIKTYPVGAAALTQYQLVKTPTALVEGAASTDDCIGIVQNSYAALAVEAAVLIGEDETFGIAFDGDINDGDLLEAAAAGRLDTHSTTSTKPVVARALQDSVAAGDFIRIQFFAQNGSGVAA